jgi:1A family penicillin-binding protein
VAFKANKTNVNLAPEIAKEILKIISEVLIFIGKPFFFVLSGIIIVTLYILLTTGRLVKRFILLPFLLLKGLANLARKIVAFGTKAKLPRIPFPKPVLPRISFRIPKKFLLILGVISVASFSVWFFILRGLPSPKDLVLRDIEVSTKIYDRNGVLLYTIYKNKNRTLVPLNKIPAHVILATLASEDAEFYTHPGFSIKGIFRALVNNATKGELTGGSTITQQLVKNALLTPEKTLSRKIKEVVLSIETELAFSKDEILEMYLNEVAYGGTAYGIQEAARIYFGKDVQNLTLSEAALLAGLPKSPTKFSPFGANPDLAISRQKDVLNLMVINKFIDDNEAEKAKEQKLVFAPNKTDIKAPHFVMYVRQLLVEKYGEEVVEKGGLSVVTTLDYSIQKLAEESVSSEISKLSPLHVGNGAAVIVNPKTGEILAMVGSKDYFDTENDGNVNVTIRPRQPGSSIKVVNYAYALSTNYTPASVLSDSPVTFSVPGQPPYSPKNYDGRYRGNLSLRSAFAESRNVPAVKVLASYGVDKMIDLGQKMGITTWQDPSKYGLSLTLGGGDVKLIDLATAYATVANYGQRPTFASILRIVNYKGKILEENGCTDFMALRPSCETQQVLDPRVAYLLIDILKDNAARSPAFGTNSALVISGHPEVAVKTGTSNNLRDNLTVGFNQDYLVAVWVGNNDNSPMSRIASGITGAAPIFNRIMSSLLAGQESLSWDIPQGLDKLTVCSLTGSLPCSGCPTRTEWFLTENKPAKACVPEQITKKLQEKSEGGQILEPAARTEIVN